jgi:hypothetical protein
MSQGGSSSLSQQEVEVGIKSTSIGNFGRGLSRIYLSRDLIAHFVESLGEVRDRLSLFSF